MSYGEDLPVVAGADLSDDEQYKAITISGTIAASATTALGILQNKPKSGEDAAVRAGGRSRARAGGAITAGNRVTVSASGWITACTSNQLGVGTALQSVSSGSIFEGYFNFAGAKTNVVSAHLS